MGVFSSAPRTLPTQLQVLYLENQRYRSPSTTGSSMHKVFDLSMPFLRDLAIRELALPPDIPPMPQLRRLRIFSAARLPWKKSRSRIPLRPRQWKQRCLPSPRGASDSPEVHLPRLSWVSLLSAHPDNACLFRYIQYPPSSRVQFHCTRIHSASVPVPAFINSGSAHFH
ncbi:hypothetical protein BDN71DRAFT_203992 [Pleurotus eryngii]|uniref:Uncharacterized protein n=1 Tax=Pleurotus eryngii TaxID=5323 RepID=A0A9P5ZMS0_PLEER|nr:hypothetical protein BDN71DRAFT_203992 [Pleurotus eryngii]